MTQSTYDIPRLLAQCDYLVGRLDEAATELCQVDVLNLRLAQQKQHISAALACIRAMEDHIHQVFTVDDLYATVVQSIVKHLAVDACALIELDLDTQRLDVCVSAGSPLALEHLPSDDTPLASTLPEELRRRHFVNRHAPNSDAQRVLHRLCGLGHFMWCPLQNNPNRVLGLLVGNVRQDGMARQPFDQTSLDALAAIGAVISQRVQHIEAVEQRLREQREHIDYLAEVVKTCPIAVLASNEHGMIDYANPAADALHGYATGELLGRHIASLYQPSGDPELWAQIQDTVRDGAVWSTQMRAVTKQGRQIYIAASAYQLLDPHNNFKALIHFHRNVTRHVQAEQRLRASEQRFRHIIESTTDYVYTVGVDNGRAMKTTHGPGCERVTGYPPDAFEKDHALWFRMVYPADRSRLQDHVASLLAGEDVGPLEHRIISRDGDLRWIRNAPVLNYHSEGELVSYEGVITDITQRKLAEEALHVKDIAIAASLNPIAMADLKGRFQYVNDAFLRLWGFDCVEEVIGRYAAEVAYEKAAAEAAMALVRDQGTWTGELLGQGRDGSTFDLQITANLVRDESGEPVCFMVWFLDITARKQAEQALRLAKETAEAASNAKSIFLANMSHEIRTPMNAIIGYGDLLAGTPLDDEQQAQVAIIQDAANSLLALLNEVLDLSKIESGKLECEMLDVPLADLLGHVDALFAPQARAKELRFQVELGSGVPTIIRTDPTRLRQCLINLVSNAIKFTPSGSVHVRLGGDNHRDQDGVRFEVEDTGIGIAPENQSRIFESFVQADHGTTRQYGGTGLGLAITRKITKLLGGTLRLHSQPGQGSTFSLWLPIGLDLDTLVELPAGPLQAPGLTQAARTSRFQGRVLIAEDNVPSAVLTELLLRRAGLETVVVSDGLALVERATAERFDLILLDIEMPRLSGRQAAVILRKHGIDIPLIAVTGRSLKEEQDACLAAGCSECLIKPVSRKALADLLRRHLTTPSPTTAPPSSEDPTQTIAKMTP